MTRHVAPDGEYGTLRRLLRRAGYRTQCLHATAGSRFVEESALIKFIRDATIETRGHRISLAPERRWYNAALEVWENDGGALGKSDK